MKAEEIISSYQNFVQMCVARDIEDVSDVHFLFELYTESFKDNSQQIEVKKDGKALSNLPSGEQRSRREQGHNSRVSPPETDNPLHLLTIFTI